MKLHLLRHAKANQSIEELDIDRVLSKKGLLQVEALNKFLSGALSNPVVWCSEATRTRMTLDGIKDAIKPSSIEYKADFYLCNKNTMLEQLWNNTSSSEVLIVGHNFGISDLLNYFTGESILMGTCEYITLDFSDLLLSETSMETGQIIEQYRPKV